MEAAREHPGAGFACSLAQSVDAVVVQLRGQLDMAAGRVLEESLDTVIAAGPRRVIVDLRAVDFMGSTGLHAFTELHHRLGPQSELLLIRGPAHVQRIFDITRVGAMLHFVDAADVRSELAAIAPVR